MNHTPQIKRAIQFAARKHHGQFRHETEPLPYITHAFSVALLVAEGGASDDVVCAALLHDTLEDTDTTREEIVANFGEHVAELVEHVSERPSVERGSPEASTPNGKGLGGDRKLGWRERKDQYLKHLEEAPEDALLIAMADKIDNIESKLEALEKEGPALLARMNGSPADYLWYHGEAARIAASRLPEHPLTKRLLSVHAREREVLDKSI